MSSGGLGESCLANCLDVKQDATALASGAGKASLNLKEAATILASGAEQASLNLKEAFTILADGAETASLQLKEAAVSLNLKGAPTWIYGATNFGIWVAPILLEITLWITACVILFAVSRLFAAVWPFLREERNQLVGVVSLTAILIDVFLMVLLLLWRIYHFYAT